ncbi:MAG: peptidylprolyl isomerase [Anaerolineales bacterium]|nr:peptidylprolyl isomerase [Anaerolineales bacterium]
MTNDLDALYQRGKEHLEAKHYADALESLRQVRAMNSGHYKDADQLIVEAQTAMQKQKWQARPTGGSNNRNVLIVGALALMIVLAFFALSNFLPAPASSSATGGGAAKLAPQQRSEMYKSAPAMTIDVNKSYVATIKTAKGTIVAELYPKDAPQHVNNFVFLARDGFFNNLTFHRVVAGFVIQGGDPQGTGTGGPGYNIPPEIKARHTNGALAMARQGGPAQTTPSSGSQFYITLAPQPGLDGQYTVFGQVTSGLEVVAKIAIGDVIQSVTIEEK